MSSELEARTKNALKQFDTNMAGIFDRKSFYEGDKYSAEAGKPKLNPGQLCFKWTLFGLNLLFLIFGCVLMSVGSYAVNNQVGAIAGATVPIGLIVVGCFIMLLALVGGVSAWRESRALLGIYFVFLLIWTIILFAVGIAVYVQRNNAAQYITSGWQNGGADVEATLQNLFGCCGLNYYRDAMIDCPTGITPVQCCADPTNVNSTASNSTCTQCACLPLMVNTFQSSFNTAGACGIAFAVIMLAGLGLVCYLMGGIKRKQEETDIAKLRTGANETIGGLEEETNPPATEGNTGEEEENEENRA